MDIIARDGATLVFVEVKARDSHAFGRGGRSGDAVQAPPDRAARARLHARDITSSNCPCRFDVVSIHFDAGEPVIEVFQGAFDATV